MQMMAASSQSMVALLSRFHEGTEEDRRKKESEKSILKTMGPTQRGLFTSLCTRRMNVEPAMTEFMRNLTTSTTPQKALNLIQSETRDWEGTFSVGGFHRMLSNGFLSQDPNRANPGGFTIFMFHPKTVDLGTKGGKGGNELLREYLGMEVDEATLEFYMRQGFYTPNTPHDLRVQLQTAHDTLELLTCDGTIAERDSPTAESPNAISRQTKRVAVGIGTPEKVTKKKKTATATANHTESSNSSVNHPNKEPVTDWTLPSGVDFRPVRHQNARPQRVASTLDTRIPKRLNKAQRAPMCVRFQSTGVCQQGCSLAHITSSAMSETARATATARFKAVYGA
ncbi:hypothetical protein MHU86_16880 [Fragilaria crotonensis]|nr:hypothetical protein MHU86_16880 [Fragilaria crotonensis]